jgi:four helix bundle protein
LAQLNSLVPVPRHRLDAYSVAVQAACLVLPHLRSVPAAYRNLGDQCSRAVSSVGLNAAEGLGRRGRVRDNHFRIAYGSALEATAALYMLSAVGGVPAVVAEEALALPDRPPARLRLRQT